MTGVQLGEVNDTLTGQPERCDLLEAAAKKKEESIIKQTGKVGDTDFVDGVLQEIDALPTNLEEKIRRTRAREEGVVEKGEIKKRKKGRKEEECNPSRPGLEERRRVREPDTRPPVIDDPLLDGKVFGYSDPTNPCRACLFTRPTRSGLAGVCDYHRQPEMRHATISLCEHKYLEVEFRLDDPSNHAGSWKVVVTDDPGYRVEVAERCKKCEKEHNPEDRCKELAERVVANFKRILIGRAGNEEAERKGRRL